MRAKRIFYTRFQKILCVFFQIFRFLVKLKPNEKAIQKIICIHCDHGISKCHIYRSILTPSLAYRVLPSRRYSSAPSLVNTLQKGNQIQICFGSSLFVSFIFLLHQTHVRQGQFVSHQPVTRSYARISFFSSSESVFHCIHWTNATFRSFISLKVLPY